MGKFDKQVVLITGAARGQGRSHAVNFAKEGANLILSDICSTPKEFSYRMGSREELDETVKECKALGAQVVDMVCDIRSDNQVKAMVDAGINKFGKIDVVINNACWSWLGKLQNIPEDTMVALIDTGLIGPIRVCKHVAPPMMKQRSGCIINIISSVINGFSDMVVYGAAKDGLRGVTKCLALELAPYNVRVNSVVPTSIDTYMNEGLAILMGTDPKKTIEQFIEGTRIIPVEVKPQHISNACMYIASEPVLTGMELRVDAGAQLKK